MNEYIDLLNSLSSDWVGLLARASVRATPVFVLVWIVCRVFGRIPPILQCWLWRWAYASLVVALLWTAPIEVPLLPAATVANGTSIPFHGMANPVGNDPVWETALNPDSRAWPMHLGSWLSLTWILGSAVFFSQLLRHWLEVRRVMSQARDVTDEALQATLTRLARRLGLKHEPRLCALPAVCSPFHVGVVRPTVVVPELMANTSSQSEIEIVLAHELAHIQRRDLIWNGLLAVAEVLFFFHPLVWLCKRHWRIAQEMVADELALQASGTSVEDYGRGLLAVVGRYPTRRTSDQLAVAMTRSFHELSRRLSAMKTYRPISCRTKWMLLVSVVLVGLVAITPWRVTAQQQSRKDQRASTEQRPVTEQRPAKTSDDKKKEAPRPATATPSQAQPPERSQPSGAEAEKGKPADPLLRRPVQIEFSNETNTFIVKGLQRDIEQVMAIVKALGQTNEKQRSPIHVEFLEGPDVVVVRGHQADVARVTGIIKELEKETQDAEPERKEAPAKPNESKLNLRKLEAEFRRLQIENIRLRRLLDEQHKHASAPNLRGIVVAVGEKDLIEVSIGHDDGLREGQQLEVFRENVYLGRVVIRKTTPDRSVAEVLKDHRMGPFKRGDRVVTRLK